MKGITPVIAVILLLLITIAMVGFAFIWFNNVMTGTQQTTQQQIEQQQRAMATKVRIDNIVKTTPKAQSTIAIKNTGTVEIRTEEMSLYVNGTVPFNCADSGNYAWPEGTTLKPGETRLCRNRVIYECTSIKITTIGTGDIVSCPS